ncbi:hypothetical protein [Endozoicomonas sp. 8E]|uniref:hypothetical protein n=1 Tax=Endozoicomonas sp. 8E TaxID=3035692 RepID=UPI002938DE0A|nr:hypothetical protein [Endozoicomonas sp. 8E]WOG29009.1 hypothetical protein P6910_04920 [Endozoicomonas sp. 8E]
MSVVCQAEVLTRYFIVELEQDAVSPKHNFSIKPELCTLPGGSSDTVEINDYAGSDSPPDNKRQRACSREGKMPLIGSISWQLFYVTSLLVAYDLILSNKSAPLSSKPYSWLPVDTVVAVSRLLKNYWNRYSLLFRPMEQQEAAFVLMGQWDKPFATISATFGSGHNPSQCQSSESSGQQAPQTHSYPKSYFNSLPYSDSGDGNGYPQQYQHTLSLNCFVHPCHGVCRLRPSSDSKAPAESPLNSEAHSTDHTGPMSHDLSNSRYLPANSNDWVIVNGLLNLRGNGLHEDTEVSCRFSHSTTPMVISETQPATGSVHLGQDPPRLSQTGTVKAAEQSGQRTCDQTVAGEDDQQRPCGIVCKSAKALMTHERNYHSGQKSCDVTVVGRDGQWVRCGIVFKNAKALSSHKGNYHSGQKNCNVIIVQEDGQYRPCGTVCKNAKSLSVHKRRYHTGQKTCQVTKVGKDGQSQPCGKVCKNAEALSDHKRRYHSGPQTCEETVVEKDGQLHPCGKFCKNARVLLYHKKAHRKRKPVDAEQDNDLRPEESKVNK